MKSLKNLKKMDSRLVQGLMMAVIVVLFLLFFYLYYVEYRQYTLLAHQAPRKASPVDLIKPPALFDFVPAPEEINRYQLFLFKENRTPAPGPEGEPAADPMAQDPFLLLGVIKKDRLYVVVRLNAGNEIHLYAQGMTIGEGLTIKEITPLQVVITDNAGGERVYPVFQPGAPNTIPLPFPESNGEEPPESIESDATGTNPEEAEKIE